MRLIDYSNFYKNHIEAVFCTPGAYPFPAARRVAERLKDVPFELVKDKNAIPPGRRTPKTLFLTEAKGNLIHPCPGSRGHLCCNYLTIDPYEGCPIACTYCILRSYLNSPVTTVTVDTAAVAAELERLVDLHPGETLRLGTGELGDSLFFDPLCELSRDLVEACAAHPGVVLELKTKTGFVDHLLGMERKGAAVIGFSLNPPAVAAAEEGCAASLEERLDAARRAYAAGFRLAFHFDPLIRTPDWEKAYGAVIDRLAEFASRTPSPIAWISLGTLRYPGPLLSRLPDRPCLYDEFILARDGKYRYLRPLREDMYRKVLHRLRRLTDAPVYLCMESPAVWRKVFGILPSKIDALCDIFSDGRRPRRERGVLENGID